jgi:hypothetical protein
MLCAVQTSPTIKPPVWVLDRITATRIIRHTTHECAAHYAAGKTTITRGIWFSKSQESEVWYTS